MRRMLVEWLCDAGLIWLGSCPADQSKKKGKTWTGRKRAPTLYIPIIEGAVLELVDILFFYFQNCAHSEIKKTGPKICF